MAVLVDLRLRRLRDGRGHEHGAADDARDRDHQSDGDDDGDGNDHSDDDNDKDVKRQ